MIDPGARLDRGVDVTVMTAGNALPVVDSAAAGLRQGFIERSNVNPVTEMSRLILDQRLFEAVTSAITDLEQTRQTALRTLGGGN